MSSSQYTNNPAHYLYKNGNMKIKNGRTLRAKVWWKLEFPIETNVAYKEIFDSLENVLVHDDRFKISNEALNTIFRRNYLYMDAEDLIYFVNSFRNAIGNQDGMIIDYRIM